MFRANYLKGTLWVVLVIRLVLPVAAYAHVPLSPSSGQAGPQILPAVVDTLQDELGYVAVAPSTGTRFGDGQLWQKRFCATTEICAVADVNGDKLADIIKFVRTDGAADDSDVIVALSSGFDFGPPQRWQDYFCTLNDVCVVGDVNGDGKSDAISFTGAAVNVALSTGSGFGASQQWNPTFCTVVDQTCAVGDVNGDGRADVLAFAADGVYVALSNGASFGSPRKWSDLACLSGKGCLIADVDGNHAADLVKFIGSVSGPSDSDVYVALSTGSQFGASQKWSDYFCTLNEICAAGDINGDGKADILAFVISNTFGDQDAVVAAISNGTAFVQADPSRSPVASAFCILNDRCATGDVTGDGKADIINFSPFNWPDSNGITGYTLGVTNNVDITAFQNRFYRFSSSGAEYLSYSTDGQTWSQYQLVSMANARHMLYTVATPTRLCMLGLDAASTKVFSCTTDPVSGWPTATAVNHLDFDVSDMAFFQGKFYATGVTADRHILISSSTDGVQWTPARFITPGDTAHNEPVLAASGYRLCLAWLSNDDQGLIVTSCTADPDGSWPGGYFIPGVTRVSNWGNKFISIGFDYVAGNFTLAWGAEADECKVAGCAMPTSMLQSPDGSTWSNVVKLPGPYGPFQGFYSVLQVEHSNTRACILYLTSIADGAQFVVRCRPAPLTTTRSYLGFILAE